MVMSGATSPVVGDNVCGNLNVYPMDGDCCQYSTVKGHPVDFLTGTGDYASGSVNFDFGLESFTKESNGHLYCSLNATTRLEPSPIDGNLFGWARIYYLAQSSKGSGVCIDDSVKCFDNGTLFVYPDLQCQGVPTAVQLSDAIQPFEDDILGSVTGQMITPTTGKTKYFWTTVQPPWNYCANLSNGIWQQLEVAEIIISLLSYLIVLSWSAHGYFKRRTLAGGLLLARCLCSIIVISLYTYYTYHVMGEMESNVIYGIVEYASAIGSLLSLFYTATFLIVLNTIKRPYNYMLYLLLFAIHIALYGEMYFHFTWNLVANGDMSFNIVSIKFLVQWKKLTKYYKMFVYVWETAPAPLMYYRLAYNRTQSFRKAIAMMHHNDKLFFPIVFIRLVAIGLVYLVQFLLDTTAFLKSDPNLFSFETTIHLLNSGLLLTQVYMLESVKKSMKSTTVLDISQLKQTTELKDNGKSVFTFSTSH
ncbi:hypothetical protein EDD86DRAFT_271718 [Gorgonomyces haynaldii]|nr:hypothetical protein EDD86DRAFT_271718 [Gorgonomyces haynaldii]